MKTTMRLPAGLCLSACILAWGASSYGQEMSKEDMMQLIQDLKQRVDALEQKVAGVEDQVPDNRALNERRIDQLEKKLDAKKEMADNDFRVYWKEGLRLDTADGDFKLKLGGRIHTDFAWFDQGRNNLWLAEDAQDGGEFRRVYLDFGGTAYENLEFNLQFGIDDPMEFKDTYIAVNDLPLAGQLKIGHFKEPFSLEQITSDNYTTFMERSLADVFAPARNLGAQLHNAYFEQRLTWAVGVFRNTDDIVSASDDEDEGWNFTTRVTGLPWYQEEGRKMLHVGAAYSHQDPDKNVRYRQRPEAHLAPQYVDTGSLRADTADLWNAEAAFVYGPFSLQGEYMLADVDTGYYAYGDADFDGWYIYASYFLTGENRTFKKSSAVFGKTQPNHNFNIWSDEERDWGAWELALRYSSLDLNGNKAIRGGEEENFTAGVNWYLNPNFRVMLNYILADIEHDLYCDDMHILQTRFQLNF